MPRSLSRNLSCIGRRGLRSILVALALLALAYALAVSVAAPSGAHPGARLADGPTPAAQCPGTLLRC